MKKAIMIMSCLLIGGLVTGAIGQKTEVATVEAKAVTAVAHKIAYTYDRHVALAFEPTIENLMADSQAVVQVRVLSQGATRLAADGFGETAYEVEILQQLKGTITTEQITVYLTGGELKIADYLEQAQQVIPESLAKSGLQATPIEQQEEYIAFASESVAQLTIGDTYVLAINQQLDSSDYLVSALGYGVFEEITATIYANPDTGERITLAE